MASAGTIDRIDQGFPSVQVDPRLGYAAFDADSHYYESLDALTRHLPREWKVRGPKWAEVGGRKRLMLGDRLFHFIPNATFDPVAKPGCMHDYFAAKLGGADPMEVMGDLEPIRPEYRDRDARLRVMDEQGIAQAWMFPTLAVCIEVSYQPDIEALLATFTAFNRWLLEDWGFAYKNRIFAAPIISLSDPEWAVKELEWCIANGARIVTMRNGPVYTRTGSTSPAAPEMDPFWARCEEAGIVVAPHAGDDGYDFLTKMWEPDGATKMLNYTPLSKLVANQRAVPDFFGALLCHRLFERFPKLRVASIENGAAWVKPLLVRLYNGYAQSKGYYSKSPVDAFRDNIWVAPFWEDNLQDLVNFIPKERILFGSDWPHVEGVVRPLDFLESVEGFNAEDTRMIMRGNAEQLTSTANV